MNGDRGRDLEVPGGLAVVARKLGRGQAQPQALPVQQGAGLRAGLAVHQPQPEPGHVAQAGHRGPGPDYQALAPGGEPDDLSATRNVGHIDRGKLIRGPVDPGHMDQAGRRQPDGLATSARPPDERHRRV